VEESGTNRLEMFSDGVFAIAATLLVLEFAVHPKAPSLGYQLLHQLWPSYLAYATSFLTIGIIWINHHHVMETIARVDRTFLFINTLLLMVVAFIPFPTRLVADFLQTSDERAAVYSYGLTLFVMAVLFNVLWAYAARDRRLIREDMPESQVRAVTQACLVGVPLTGLVLLLATWTPVGAIIFALAISAFYLPGAARFDRS
jgi:uncharacterized membrane protein